MDESVIPAAPPPPLTTRENPAEQAKFYTYADAASALRITVQTLMRWVKAGRVPSPKYFGATARFTSDQIAIMQEGILAPGTYERIVSLRAKITSEHADKQRRKKAKKPIAKKPIAKKPIAKKPIAKTRKGGAK